MTLEKRTPSRREYPDRPVVGVGAVIVRDRQAVLVRRAAEPHKGEWSLPGGVLELGESLRGGAAREAREETGLVVEAGEILAVLDRIVPDSQGRVLYHYVLVDLLCRPISGELCAGSDVSEARWVRAEDLEQFKVAAPAAAVIRKGLDSIT